MAPMRTLPLHTTALFVVAAVLLLANVPSQSGVHALAPAMGSDQVGPGSGVNKTAREAVYATCPQCDLQICCTPVQEVLNIQVNSCTNNSTKLDCACLESNVYTNSTVKTAADQCGCGCINCCYDALSAGSMTGCPASRCGIVTG